MFQLVFISVNLQGENASGKGGAGKSAPAGKQAAPARNKVSDC